MKKINTQTEMILLIIGLAILLACWLYFTAPQMDLSGPWLRISCALGAWLGAILGVEESGHGQV